MNELKPAEMTKEELEGLLDKYRDENVRLEQELDSLKRSVVSAPITHRAVADFKIINLAYKYKDIDDSSWYGASEYISRLVVYKGYEPYGYIQNTENGPVQAMIKYKEEA